MGMERKGRNEWLVWMNDRKEKKRGGKDEYSLTRPSTLVFNTRKMY